MSTNYYFINKEKRDLRNKQNNLISTLKEDVWNLIKNRIDEQAYINPNLFNPINEDFNNNYLIENTLDSLFSELNIVESVDYEIHICQVACGWSVLFEKNKEFSSVRELKEFYNKNKDVYIIEDEYGRKLTWDEFKEKAISWTGKERGDYKDVDGYCWGKYEFS